MNSLITVSELTHNYGVHTALKNMSFSVDQGEVIGILGPNGAGKTTTIRLLNGLLMPTSGDIEVFGMDPIHHGEEVRKRTGVLTETPALYERLTALQNLTFFGVMSGMTDKQLKPRIDEMLSFFDLEERTHHRVSTFSKGMKQRLALARAILHSPEILFLDEPTSGLDPEAARRVHQLISNISKLNKQTVLICTHNLSEAQSLCDRFIILEKGYILANGSLEQLRSKFFPDIHVAFGFNNDADQCLSALDSMDGISNIEMLSSEQLRIVVPNNEVIAKAVTNLAANDAQINSIVQEEVSLEEIYFHIQHGEVINP